MGSGGLSRGSLLVAGSLLVMFLIAGTAFAITETRHVSVMHAASVEAEPTGVELTEESDALATFAVENPTGSDITITNAQNVYLYVDGEYAGNSRTTPFSETTIPAGETGEAVVRLEATTEIEESGEMTAQGYFEGTIANEEFRISTAEPTDE